jgi:Na+/proline symporter
VNKVAAFNSQGYVITFLFAGGIVLWGALGQVMTLASLIAEFLADHSIDLLVGGILEGLAWVLFLLLIIYGLISLYGTAKNLSSTVTDQPQPARYASGVALSEEDAKNLKAPLPEWSLP